MCVPTTYAKSQGAWTVSSYAVDKQTTCSWWLRSPGKQQNQAMFVDWSWKMFYAWVSTEDEYAYIHFGKGVRPALWIDLNSAYFQDI